MEDGGRSSGFLPRAAFNGSTQSKHVQAVLPAGGASTDGKDVINGLFRTYDDWFAARKAGPGGSSGAGRPDIMEVYEGLDSRLYRGSDKCVAYDIDVLDLKGSIRSAPADTCPGPSGISVPLLKLIPDEYLELLCILLNLILQWGALPESFDLGYIFPIPKKGVFTPENSRPISLLEVHMKLLTRIVNRRLVYALVDEGYFSEAQFGFHPGRSCPDAFHILLGAVEDAAERKREIHICLVDLTKAFDSLSGIITTSLSPSGPLQQVCSLPWGHGPHREGTGANTIWPYKAGQFEMGCKTGGSSISSQIHHLVEPLARICV
jgi:hypothetical protein